MRPGLNWITDFQNQFSEKAAVLADLCRTALTLSLLEDILLLLHGIVNNAVDVVVHNLTSSLELLAVHPGGVSPKLIPFREIDLAKLPCLTEFSSSLRGHAGSESIQRFSEQEGCCDVDGQCEEQRRKIDFCTAGTVASNLSNEIINVLLEQSGVLVVRGEQRWFEQPSSMLPFCAVLSEDGFAYQGDEHLLADFVAEG